MRLFFNDNPRPDEPGDVEFYSSEERLFKHLEPWIADEPHLVFSEDGVCYRVESDRAQQMRLREIGRTLTLEEMKNFVERSDLPKEIQNKIGTASTLTDFKTILAEQRIANRK